MRYETKSVRCLGIDPGIANCGWSVVGRYASGYRLISDGIIKTDCKRATSDRLLAIYQQLSEVVQHETPNLIAIERCFHNKNVTSSMKTGAVIGIVLLVAAQFGCEVVELTPQQVKAATGLGGNANKKAVQRMMCKIFQREHLNHHVADAAACAIAGLLHGKRIDGAIAG